MARAKQISSDTYIGVKDLRAQFSEDSLAIVEGWYSSLTPEQHEKMIFYLTVGSQNQYYRSKIQDGEVTTL